MAEIKLQRLNVVKVVDSEYKADQLRAKGFVDVVEKKTTATKKAESGK